LAEIRVVIVGHFWGWILFELKKVGDREAIKWYPVLFNDLW
jgi:hypothetical protein